MIDLPLCEICDKPLKFYRGDSIDYFQCPTHKEQTYDLVKAKQNDGL